MNRQQRRAKAKSNKSLTKEELQRLIKIEASKCVKKNKEDILDESINTAMQLLLAFPIMVIIENDYDIDIKEFTEKILDCYYQYQNGEITMEEIQKMVWEYGGVRLEKV